MAKPTGWAWTLSILTIILFGALPGHVSGAQEERGSFVWSEVQPRGGYLAGHAELDGAPGDELLVTGLTGGFYAARGDGQVLWRHVFPGWSRPAIAGDLDGDGGADVVAATGFPKMGGGLVAIRGRTGQVMWSMPVHSPVGSVRTGDLNGDGAIDLVVPSVDGTIRIRAFFGPAFEEGWTATLPGQMDAFWVFGESLDVGDLDGDGRAEVAFGTRNSGNAGGKVLALDGSTGAIRWQADTGSVFSVKVVDGTVLTYVWHVLGFSFRGELVAYSAAGGESWRLPLDGFITSGGVLTTDLDGDGSTEAVLATASSQEGSLLFGLDPSSYILHAVGVADGRPRWVHKVTRDVVQLAAVPRAGAGSDVAYGTDAFLSISTDEQVGLVSGLTGAPLWVRLHTGETIDEAIQGLEIADLDGDGSAEVVYSSPEQRMTALAPGDGAVRFRRSYPGVWLAAVAGDPDGDGRLDTFGGGGDGLVRAVDDGGQTRWAQPIGGPLAGVDLAGGSLLAVAFGQDATVSSFDARTGAPGWTVPTGVRSLAGFSRHQVAFGDVDGDGTDDVVVGGSVNERPSVVAIGGRTGTLLWRAVSPLVPPNSQPAATQGRVTSVRVLDGGQVAAVIQGFLEHEVTPRAVLLGPNGGPVWTTKDIADGNDVTILPLGDRLLFAADDRHLAALNRSDGSVAWTEDLGMPTYLLAAGDRVVAFARETGLQRTFSARTISAAGVGSPVTDPKLPAARGVTMVRDDGVAYATTHGLFVLDLQALVDGTAGVRDELHLPVYTNLNGTTFEYPAATQVIGASAGGVPYAIGLRDILLLTGSGGEVPGVWVAELGS